MKKNNMMAKRATAERIRQENLRKAMRKTRRQLRALKAARKAA